MPRSEKTYPEWVQKQRTRGTTVKKKGDAYYLYKRTSKRVPGKKYPQPVDTYIGIITPEGVVKTNRKKVTLTDVEVWEYGYSKAVWELCPEEWKKPLGEDWADVLRLIILKESPTSYLGREAGKRTAEDLQYQFAAQTASLSRRLYKEHGVGLKDLEVLKTVYLVVLGKETALTKIGPGQRALLDSLGIGVEV